MQILTLHVVPDNTYNGFLFAAAILAFSQLASQLDSILEYRKLNTYHCNV